MPSQNDNIAFFYIESFIHVLDILRRQPDQRKPMRRVLACDIGSESNGVVAEVCNKRVVDVLHHLNRVVFPALDMECLGRARAMCEVGFVNLVIISGDLPNM